jgi:hypothetical protein
LLWRAGIFRILLAFLSPSAKFFAPAKVRDEIAALTSVFQASSSLPFAMLAEPEAVTSRIASPAGTVVAEEGEKRAIQNENDVLRALRCLLEDSATSEKLDLALSAYYLLASREGQSDAWWVQDFFETSKSKGWNPSFAAAWSASEEVSGYLADLCAPLRDSRGGGAGDFVWSARIPKLSKLLVLGDPQERRNRRATCLLAGSEKSRWR